MSSAPAPERLALLRWSTSRRLWVVSLVVTVWVTVLSGALGAVVNDVPVVVGIRVAILSPHALLLAGLAGWVLACFTVQSQWDHSYRAGQWRVAGDPSPSAVATIAAFSTVGVVAAGVALPVFVTATSSVTLLATGITAVVVPTATPLLLLKFAELLAADRYRLGLSVAPAVWHVAWTWPLVLYGWHMVTPAAELLVPLPPHAAAVWSTGTAVSIGAWDAAFLAIAMPTVVAYVYCLRRSVECFLRLFLP